MSKFKIVGRRPVAGKQPGEVLSEDDLEGVDVDALVRGGHVVEVKKATRVVEQEQEETD